MSERSLCLYIRVCAVTYMTGTQTWVTWKFSLNSHLFGAAIWERFAALFLGWERGELSAIYSHVVICSLCCRYVVHFDFRVFRKKYAPISR